MTAIKQQVRAGRRRDDQIEPAMNPIDLCRSRRQPRPREDGGAHRPDERRFHPGEHLREIVGNLSGGEPQPVNRRDLRQRMQPREQAVDLLLARRAADEKKRFDFSEARDFTGDHPAERRADQRIAIADSARLADCFRDRRQRCLALVRQPVGAMKSGRCDHGAGNIRRSAPMPGSAWSMI